MRQSSISRCTIASKINVTPKGVYLPISNLHSISLSEFTCTHHKSHLLLRSNFMTECCTAVFLTIWYLLGVTFILLAMVRIELNIIFYSSVFVSIEKQIVKHMLSALQEQTFVISKINHFACFGDINYSWYCKKRSQINVYL